MNFYNSTIGKKVVVALTGLILFGFVVGHLVGNLQVFEGPEKLNAYAEFLRKTKPLLWGTRIVLLISVFLHIINTIQLARRNKQSRPVAYTENTNIQASFSSRFMLVSGIFLGGYIIYHLLHFTFGSLHPDFSSHDVYHNIIAGFSHASAAWIYILAMVALGFHLHHGIWSVFQTLGLNHPKYNGLRRFFATSVSILIAGGFISIPAAVLLGVLH